MLVDQPGQHPPRGMTPLAGRVQVLAQHHIDQRLGRIQRGAENERRFRAGGDADSNA